MQLFSTAGDVMEDDPIAILRTICLSICSLLALLLGGCAQLYDPIDESLTCIHCEVEAMKTWHYVRSRCETGEYPHHFGSGFRAGYLDVCRGGTGCPPTLPPRIYWTHWYRGAAGQAKTLEWFNGFSAGAAAATQAGHQHSGRLVTSADVGGGCGCEQNVEYDFSQSPQLSPSQQNHGPQPTPVNSHSYSGMFPPGASPYPQATQPNWQSPASECTPSEGGSTTAPYGHSLSTPLNQPMLPPASPSPRQNGGSSFMAPSVPPSWSEQIPFGHSAPQQSPSQSDSPPRIPQRSLPIDEAPPLLQTVEPSETSAPAPGFIPRERPKSTPDEAPTTKTPKVPDGPPLEDMFLPRPDQSAEKRPLEMEAVRHAGSHRSNGLFEGFSRIERASQVSR